MSSFDKDTILRFVKLTENARTPTRRSSKAAGLDLYSAYDMIVPARGNALIATDLQIQLPNGCYGRIAPRSGLALGHHIDVGGGVIDQDYRGALGVIMFNHSDTTFVVSRGDRIAQLICEKIHYPILEEVKILDTTERDKKKGFGSTGKN
jgi:dUTP pyrophosphatase